MTTDKQDHQVSCVLKEKSITSNISVKLNTKKLQSDRCFVHHFKIRKAHENQKAAKNETKKVEIVIKDLNQTGTESDQPTKKTQKLEEPQNNLAILMNKSKPAISIHKLLMMS